MLLTFVMFRFVLFFNKARQKRFKRLSQLVPLSPLSPFSPSLPSGPSIPGRPIGPMAPGDPGGPGLPAGPAGPGRLQTSCEGWMVMLRPFLAEAYNDWQQAADSRQTVTHIWSMTIAVGSQEFHFSISCFYFCSWITSHKWKDGGIMDKILKVLKTVKQTVDDRHLRNESD